jgi:TrmH family RNA methyltransferase
VYVFIQIQKYYILVSKNQTKLITSLQQKKYRDQTGLFVAEGPKVIAELLSEGLVVHAIFTTVASPLKAEKNFQVTETELQKISFLKTANTSLAVFEKPKPKPILKIGLTVVLDAIRDPGNLGTIIRLCDWFGVKQLICSEDTVDCYNPKVVQATMGSLARVAIQYSPLQDFFEKTSQQIYGACMEGNTIYSEKLAEDAIIVLGNEANGISEPIMKKLHKKVTIPRFGDTKRAESLNVATAAAIFLSEFRSAIER